jgi:uncharacterized alkaline shock family protein YloU
MCKWNHFQKKLGYSKMSIAKGEQSKGGTNMSIELKTKYGQIDISTDVIAIIAGGAAIENYGIIGMASKNQIKDGITEILKKENFKRGIIVRQENDEVHIDMYIIVSYGTKISEVAHNVQTKVKYTLNQTVGLAVDSVNIFVQGVRVTNP